MINFHCEKCSTPAKARLLVTDNSNERCHCPDLPERFKKRFWDSSIEKQAAEAVKINRELNRLEGLERGKAA